MNIDTDKCDSRLVAAELKRLGLDVPKAKAARVKALAAYYIENYQVLDIAECEICGGESDASLPACPFCGEAGVVDEHGNVLEPVESGENPVEDADDAAATSVAADALADVEHALEADELDEAPSDEPDGEPDGALDEAQGSFMDEDDESVVVEVEELARVAAPIVPSSAKLTATERYTIVMDEARESLASGAIALHTLGGSITKLVDGDLFKVSGHTTLAKFFETELHISKSHAFRAMAVNKAFTSEEIRDLSGRQVRYALELVNSGADKGSAIETATSPRVSERVKELAAPAPASASKKRVNLITLSQPRQEVPLYVRPKDDTYDTAEATPATFIKEEPWGLIEADNGVDVYFQLTTDALGKLVLVVDIRGRE